MYSVTNLLIFYLGGGFVIMLAWAGVLGEILLGASRSAVRWSVGILAILGAVHPAAAVASWDLVRLGQSTDERELEFSRLWHRVTQAAIVVSTAVAIALWTVTTTS